MQTYSKKQTRAYLLIGVLLMVLTMVLHPSAGNFEQLLDRAGFAITAHSLAIFSIPFSALGFWGLNAAFKEERFLSRLALACMFTGLIAAMLAATVNGLALPLFVKGYAGASAETVDALRPVFAYNQALNHGLDYILIGAIFLSTLLWSVAILRSRLLPIWVGYMGLGLVAALLTAVLAGFYFLDLYGFRIFIFGWVAWIVAVAVRLPGGRVADRGK